MASASRCSAGVRHGSLTELFAEYVLPDGVVNSSLAAPGHHAAVGGGGLRDIVGVRAQKSQQPQIAEDVRLGQHLSGAGTNCRFSLTKCRTHLRQLG